MTDKIIHHLGETECTWCGVPLDIGDSAYALDGIRGVFCGNIHALSEYLRLLRKQPGQQMATRATLLEKFPITLE